MDCTEYYIQYIEDCEELEICRKYQEVNLGNRHLYET